MADTTEITAAIEAVVFRNTENGYSVLRCVNTEDKREFTAVGSAPDVSPGEELVMAGTWGMHSSYGEQFNIETFTRRAPEGADGIYRYLASGAIRGVGPGLARAIIIKFGDRALQVIEETPERLAEVRGISPKHAKEISADFKRSDGLRRLADFLAAYAISPLVASRLYKTLGEEAIESVRENPYLLAQPGYNAKFSEADKLASGLGFPHDAAERIEAAILFELRHNLNNGHVFLPADKLAGATAAFLYDDENGGVDEDTITDALDMLTDEGVIARDEVAGVDACYLPDYYEAETFVAQRLAFLAGSVVAPDATKIERILDDVERGEGLTYAEEQREAVLTAAKSRVMVLTGGPGTGKTTSVRAILALYDALDYKTVLCAPTGRAAKRMSELTGREAATVHRALSAAPSPEGELIFERDETNPLKCDAVIVDEASMLDLPLTRALLCALPDTCRVLFVGDENQLPSVGPGNVLADIVRSGAVPVVTLTEIFRQARESGIVRAAHMVNRGETPDLSDNKSDMFFLKRQKNATITDTIADLVARRLPENMKIPSSQIQVLTPTRRGDAGTATLNLRLQQELNPASGNLREHTRGGFTYRENDKVMQIRNNYDIMWTDERGKPGAGVYNGDLGVITRIDPAAGAMTVDFEDKIVEYAFAMMDDIEPAYAMTVHKSQGSEYRAVVLAIPTGIPLLTSRAILYTAITRARELLVCVGSQDVFEEMIRNNRRQQRYSGLRARLLRG